MRRLEGKVAVITGGATGIGRGTARLFAREGARVAILDVNEAGAEESLALIRADGHTADFIRCDVSRRDQVEQAVAEVLARHGRIDVLHANAGVELVKTLHDTTEAEWDRVININLKGVYLCAHAVLPVMRAQGQGAIVITSSPHALQTYKEMAAYAASKGGVLALTRALALDEATNGIRVNAILPGAVDTPMVRREAESYPDPAQAMEEFARLQPIGRLGQPEDIAPAVLFLASDEAAFITGAHLSVDGGAMARL